MYSKRLIRALVVEVIVIAAVIGLNLRCLMAQSNLEGNIYTYGYGSEDIREELKLYAPTIWENVKRLEEVEFVTSEKAYSVTILMHRYEDGYLDPTVDEWVVVVSSFPEIGEEVKIIIVRLDYESFDLKGIHKFIYLVEKELSLEEVVPIMENELLLNHLLFPLYACPYACEDVGLGIDTGCCVDKKKLQFLGGNYIYSANLGDRAGTIIVNKYAGKPILLLPTWWAGRGGLCNLGRNIYIKGTGTKGRIGKEIRVPVRIHTAPCEVYSFEFDVTYDPDAFEYTSVEPGELAESFAAIEAHPFDAGRLRIEGHTEKQGISQGANGNLVWLKFKLW
ncbi:MAG: cohesin domain-containing protein [Nitrospirota bacterium]